MTAKGHPQAHVMFLGSSLTGKTTAAKKLNEGYIKAGKKEAIVLAEVPDPDFKTPLLTTDADEFFRWLKLYPGSNAFLDDAEGRYSGPMEKAARIGRHWGNRLHFMATRYALLSPTIRSCCSELFLFNIPVKDCRELSEQWNCKALGYAYQLVPGQFIHLRKFGKPEFGNIFS
jgi:hypothetical protein